MKKQLPVLILDTDIGPDCDDVGALAMALNMEKAGLCRLAAVTHSTSNPFGVGCADAICRHLGRTDMPIGTLKRKGILEDERYQRYNKAITEEYPNRFGGTGAAEDAVSLLRRVIAEEPTPVVLVTIGPLSNIGDLLISKGCAASPLDGVSLLREKGTKLVCMGAGNGAPEFNFYVDAAATATVLGAWPNEAVFSIYETGIDIITGTKLQENGPANDPLVRSYALYSPQGRSSWDQTTVYYAVLGAEALFSVSEPGWMGILPDGKSVWRQSPEGRHFMLHQKETPEAIAQVVDAWMVAHLA